MNELEAKIIEINDQYRKNLKLNCEHHYCECEVEKFEMLLKIKDLQRKLKGGRYEK